MSGGGGSSGSVNYPNHMKWTHAQWLSNGHTGSLGGADLMDSTVVELMNAGIRSSGSLYNVTTASPYNGATVIDPNTVFFATGDTLTTYNAQNPYKLLSLFLTEDPESLYSSYYTESYIDPDDAFFDTAHSLSDYAGQSAYELLELLLAEDPEGLYTAYADDAAATAMIASFSTDLATEYNARIIPLYNVGYSDLNATASSAYAIGLSHIAAQQTREVAKFTAEIKTKIAMERIDLKEKWRKLLSVLSIENIKTYIATKNTETEMKTRTALQRTQMKMEWRRILSVLSVENARMYIIAKREEVDVTINYDAKDALWDLGVYQYGCQVMASIAGASTVKTGGESKPSVLGATLSGAATGAMIGSIVPGLGTTAGAIIGGAMGLASTL